MHKKPLDFLVKVCPILGWIGDYNGEKAVADFIAGVTVGLTLIPQTMAYAALAGLEPQYGLYSSLCGGIIYAIFGTVPQLSIAPTALLSLLTMTYTSQISFGNVQATILLCFFSGLVELLCGIFHLGFLVDFVSTPVVVGLTSAGAILIASAQIKSVLGLQYRAEKFIDIWRKIFEHVGETNFYDAALSLICCCLLLLLRQLKDFSSSPGEMKKNRQRSYKVILWFICVSRNAIVVITSSVIAYFWCVDNQKRFTFSGQVPSGLPTISLPPFQITTNNHTLTFPEIIGELGTAILVMPALAILANIAVAKSFSKGKVVNASQEMTAIGICNLTSSLLSSMPINASFSRAAVTNASGVKTPFSGVYSSIIVLLSLTFLTPYFSYIPKAALASVIICAVIFMVETTIAHHIWKLHKIDIIPLTSTFFACLFLGIEIGIVIGIFVDLLMLLFYISRPKLEAHRVIIEGNEYLKIVPSSSIYYPSAEYIRNRIIKSGVLIEKNKGGKVVIIDCSRISKTDYTTAKCLGSLADDLQKGGKTIAFLKLEPHLTKMLSKTCRNCIFAFTDDVLVEILKERRNSDILNSYKSIQISNGDLPAIFETVESKM
ncbi:sodium-independent sulfate anion transporter-like [Onthophagus taurus]|uniref:sodium-independent sulfate anion transporter-like n=1 Tax=Onthophagus taurus TaxID=166361 RepID=UPI0039BE42ED